MLLCSNLVIFLSPYLMILKFYHKYLGVPPPSPPIIELMEPTPFPCIVYKSLYMLIIHKKLSGTLLWCVKGYINPSQNNPSAITLHHVHIKQWAEYASKFYSPLFPRWVHFIHPHKHNVNNVNIFSIGVRPSCAMYYWPHFLIQKYSLHVSTRPPNCRVVHQPILSAKHSTIAYGRYWWYSP